MATIYNRRTTGLFENGACQKGDSTNFGGYSTRTESGDYLSNGRALYMNNVNARGSGTLGNQFIPVDTSKVYQLAYSVKTVTQSYNSRNGSGHLGYACYDENKSFIDLRNIGGLGNTTLSRPVTAGDSAIYITSNSGWPTGSSIYTTTRAYHRGVMFFPANHSTYNVAHKYTRLARVQYYSLTETDQGDYELLLDSQSGSQLNSYSATTFPSFSGYTLPAGTPISRASAGGTYNYAMGNPVYPQTWTTYSAVCTGEGRSSGAQFRHGTKFIKFLNLRNYNYRTETGGDAALYVMDNLFFGEIPSTNDTLPTSFLQSDRFR